MRRESACSGDCHKCSGCGAQAQQVFVRAENAIGAQPGDKVIVTSQTRQVLPAIFVVYILPLVLMLLGYFAGLALKLSAGVLACAGFALGVAAIVAYDRLIARRRGVTYVVTAFAEN